MPICGKWASATSPCRSGCGPLPKPFTAGKPPTLQPSMRRTRGPLRRRWHAISFREATTAEPRNWGAMRARRGPCPLPRTTARFFAAKSSFRGLRLLPRNERKMHERKMRDHKSDKQAPAPWQVPVAIEDVAETGRHFDLVADTEVRAAVARLAGL